MAQMRRLSVHRAAWTTIADEALRVRAYGRHQGGLKRLMAEAAERVLEDATDDEKTVYRLRYVDGMNSRMASDTMYVSEATYYRILRGLIDKVERELA